MYRFYLTIGASTIEAHPLGFNNTTLVKEKERNQQFYRTKFKGDLVFIGGDYELIWAVESSDPCERIGLLIEKYNGATWATYFEGYFTTSDGEIDIDKCRFAVNPLTDDVYAVALSSGGDEYNILDVTPAVTAVASGESFTRCRHLIDVIEHLVVQAYPGYTVVSDLLNAPFSEVFNRYNNYQSLMIAQKSDIKRPTSSDPATIALLSLHDLMNMIRVMFNAYWDIEGATFRIEHISYFESASGIDLTGDILSHGSRNFRYQKGNMPKHEKFNWMEANNADFVGASIRYDSNCVNNDADNNTREVSVKASTDLEFIRSEPGAISDDGFVFLATQLRDGVYHVMDGVGVLSGVSRDNLPMSWSELHRNFHLHDRVLPQGYLNNQLTAFSSVKRTRVQSLPAILSSDFDPSQYLTTLLGVEIGQFAYVDRAEITPHGKAILDLVYGYDLLTPAVPTSVNMDITVTSTHIYVGLNTPVSTSIIFYLYLNNLTCQTITIPANSVTYSELLDDDLPVEFNFSDDSITTNISNITYNGGIVYSETVGCVPSDAILEISVLPVPPQVTTPALAGGCIEISYEVDNTGSADDGVIFWQLVESGVVIDTGSWVEAFSVGTAVYISNDDVCIDDPGTYKLKMRSQDQMTWIDTNEFTLTE